MRKLLLYGVGLVLLLGNALALYLGVQGIIKRRKPQARLLSTLSRLTTARKNAGFKGKHALVLSLPPESRIILISSILGNNEALQTLYAQLQKETVLSSKGELAKDTYLMVNGGLLGENGQNAQILAQVAGLMKRNSQRVFYIRDPQEMVDALGQYFAKLFGQIPFPGALQQIRSFYATLPMGIYLFAEDLTEDPVRIASYGKDADEFTKIACEPFEGEGPIKSLCTLGSLCSYGQGPLGGTIDGNDQQIDWKTMQGLQFKQGSWHLLSSPRKRYKQLHCYTSLAYAVITMGETLGKSTITFYHTEDSPDPFIQGGTFNLISGKKV